MKKMLLLALVGLMVVSMLAGCAGTVVVIDDCTCPGNEEVKPADGAVKTGLAVTTKISDSTSAAEDKEGAIEYDVTMAAVTVDGDGVILSCSIDSVPASLKIDDSGSITSDITAAIQTKNERGASYGMVAYGGAIAEWDAQVAALCDYAVGKTVAELKNGAIDETGKAPEGSDLASSATIYLGGYVSAIEAAVKNAQYLGASEGDTLALVTENTLSSSVAATEEKDGTAQLDVSIGVVTSKDGVITSCIIDAVQAKINFSSKGVITSDLSAQVKTKNELGADYGMVAWGNAKAEWNQQAASFASYVTGKTLEQVNGIAVTEGKPADADLAASVTISIGGFQSLIAKALGT